MQSVELGSTVGASPPPTAPYTNITSSNAGAQVVGTGAVRKAYKPNSSAAPAGSVVVNTGSRGSDSEIDMQPGATEEEGLRLIGSGNNGDPLQRRGAAAVAARRAHIALAVLGCFSLAALIVAIYSASRIPVLRDDVQRLQQRTTLQGAALGAGSVPVSRVAFGSCTAYDLRPQPVWTEGVIPSKPDAWVWLGDMAYLDDPSLDCSLAPRGYTGCVCNTTWLTAMAGCRAGDITHALGRYANQLSQTGYRAFLEYMCPGYESAAGTFPPTGSDPHVCPRAVLGTYDDHDFGWNNGNTRLPDKHAFKNMYLDALGEPQDSARRSSATGLQAHYVLNKGVKGREIGVLLLDERYHRDTLPCERRRAWCEAVLASSSSSAAAVWCQDFLVADAQSGSGVGSCCTKDEDMARWCALPSSKLDDRWPIACDTTSDVYASRPLLLASDNTTLLELGEEAWEQEADAWPRLVQAGSSSMCEVLGVRQRRWLSAQLESSTAPLLLVASGSVVFGSVGWENPGQGSCSGDDWECWRPAQLNLVHTLANYSKGCVVIITGDYHYGDIKVLAPGKGRNYTDHYMSDRLDTHIYQVMASGMTPSTAHYVHDPCEATYREDLVGLRPGGHCAYFGGPNFGMVEVDWADRVATLSVRDANGGGVARSAGGVELQVKLSLDTCAPV